MLRTSSASQCLHLLSASTTRCSTTTTQLDARTWLLMLLLSLLLLLLLPLPQVAAEDNFERDLQGFLKATLKIGRPPAKCAVFDCRPAGMVQAHEAEFKGVAMVSHS
jgi:hypothetical protein